jgi:hypothetical protein
MVVMRMVVTQMVETWMENENADGGKIFLLVYYMTMYSYEAD